jgi:hypothetical protein
LHQPPRAAGTGGSKRQRPQRAEEAEQADRRRAETQTAVDRLERRVAALGDRHAEAQSESDSAASELAAIEVSVERWSEVERALGAVGGLAPDGPSSSIP